MQFGVQFADRFQLTTIFCADSISMQRIVSRQKCIAGITIELAIFGAVTGHAKIAPKACTLTANVLAHPGVMSDLAEAIKNEVGNLRLWQASPPRHGAHGAPEELHVHAVVDFPKSSVLEAVQHRLDILCFGLGGYCELEEGVRIEPVLPNDDS